MPLILPNSFANATNADAAPLQENFDVLEDYVNHGLILADGSVPMTAPLVLVGDPIPAADDKVAANKGYVDGKTAALNTAKVNKAGDTMTGGLVMGANKVTSTATPTAVDDLTRKKWVDDTFVKLAGSTMTGDLVMGANQVTTTAVPVNANDMTRKGYVDAQDNTRLPLAGGTMLGDIVMGINQVTTTANPVSANDMARKAYVDAQDDARVAVAGDRMTGDLDVGAGTGYDTAGVHVDHLGQILCHTDTNDSANMALSRGGSAGAQDVAQGFLYFRRGTVVIGQIIINDSTHVAYGTSSDYRIKDDLGPVADPLGVINALQPKHLRYKDSGYEFDGFIAHEVQGVVPLAVTGEKDAVYADDHPMFPGEDNLQQLDVSQLVPYLVGAIQVLTERIAVLEDA
jgi:hypothetical protein